MILHKNISENELRAKIKTGAILFGGNKNLKIYGKLNCKSGKRMKSQNRVFFSSEEEALTNNFRPCGHCLRIEYKEWKDGFRKKYGLFLTPSPSSHAECHLLDTLRLFL